MTFDRRHKLLVSIAPFAFAHDQPSVSGLSSENLHFSDLSRNILDQGYDLKLGDHLDGFSFRSSFSFLILTQGQVVEWWVAVQQKEQRHIKSLSGWLSGAYSAYTLGLGCAIA